MQTAKTLLSIIHERGKGGLPLERVYRHLFNRELYLMAYGRIYRNAGAMTRGSTDETVDGMSLVKIETIIEQLRSERYRWTPVRRVYVAKKGNSKVNKKLRPLGIPTWPDKLLQEVIRLILEAYFEPQFSPHSHGFRPGRGCHTALREIQHTWVGTAWFIEGDISHCFDSLDRTVLMGILSERIHDNRFLRLIEALLKAGYLEDWKYHATLSGTPQGGVVSPILSNIYLDRLDKFVEHELLPTYNRGAQRRMNSTYNRMNAHAQRLRRQGQRAQALHLRRQLWQMPSHDCHDPEYRRLRFIRYADDFALAFCGPKAEAEEIKHRLKTFLREELKLELSEAKTLITHARSGTARFLGYDIHVIQSNAKRDHRGKRTCNGNIGFKIPLEVVKEKRRTYQHHGRPARRSGLIRNTVFSIIDQFQQEFRGLADYYRLAYNLHILQRLKWTMEMSLTLTLADKLRLTVGAVCKRYRITLQTPDGSRKVFREVIEREGKKPLVAQWGGISLKRQPDTKLDDSPKPAWNDRTEIVQRLLAEKCELCGSTQNIEVHHIRALKDLNRRGRNDKPKWVKVMAMRHRKTLVVCRKCHDDIHAGRAD